MKFDLWLRITEDDGGVVEHDLFTFTRAEPAIEKLGMTLEEGKKLLTAVQQTVLEAQSVLFVEQQRACPNRDFLLNIGGTLDIIPD